MKGLKLRVTKTDLGFFMATVLNTNTNRTIRIRVDDFCANVFSGDKLMRRRNGRRGFQWQGIKAYTDAVVSLSHGYIELPELHVFAQDLSIELVNEDRDLWGRG